MVVRYNTLPNSEELSLKIPHMHLQGLAQIFVKYNVHDRLGVHLIHGHAKVSTGHVMLGRNLKDPAGCWTKPAPLKDVNLEEVHGHIFMLVGEDRFVAYEYVEGRATDLSSIGSDFFKELATFVRLNGLEGTVGLQIRGPATEDMIEFDFGECGTVMLNAHDTGHDTPFRTTGWVFDYSDGVISYKGKEAHAPTTKGPHKVFIDGKLAPDAKALKSILRSYKAIP